MSNNVFQSVIIQLKEATDRTFGVIDTEGCVISCTDINLLGERWPDAAVAVVSMPPTLSRTTAKFATGVKANAIAKLSPSVLIIVFLVVFLIFPIE